MPRRSALARLDDVDWPPLRIARVEPFVLRDDTVEPVRGAFGAMSYRPGLFIRIVDTDGCSGHGEIWANFPEGGAAYKAALVHAYAAPLLEGRELEHPARGFDLIEARLASLVLQVGDFGAFAQVAAGIDQALWDLFCKRAGAPFWQLAGGSPRVGVYASGIGPANVADVIREQSGAGHTRFKIKLGFGDETDRKNLEHALRALPAGGMLLTDANQAWSVAEAQRWLQELEALGIGWCEEPVRADTPLAEWARLSGSVERLRVAGGENLRTLPAFLAAAAEGGVAVVQPDLGKWGGISGALRLDAALAEGAWLCPHWLSGAIGLAASLQLVGATRHAGIVEMDANPNALRTGLLDRSLRVEAGTLTLSDEPGLVPALRAGALGA